MSQSVERPVDEVLVAIAASSRPAEASPVPLTCADAFDTSIGRERHSVAHLMYGPLRLDLVEEIERRAAGKHAPRLRAGYDRNRWRARLSPVIYCTRVAWRSPGPWAK